MPSAFTQTFDAEGGFPGLGQFTIEFRPGTQWILGSPVERTTYVAGGSTDNWKRDLMVVTSVDLGPAPSRSDILDAAIFTGMCVGFDLPFGPGSDAEAWSITGPSHLAWLGDAESPGKGPGVGDDGLLAAFCPDLETYLDLYLGTHGYANGLTYTVGASVSTNNLAVDVNANDSARDRINKLIRMTDTATEYRLTVDGELLFAARGGSEAFLQTPQVMFTSDPATTRDGDLWSFQIKGRVVLDYADEADTVSASNPGSWSLSGTYTDRIGKDFGGTNNGTFEAFLGTSDELQNANTDDQLDNTFRRKERTRGVNVFAHTLADFLNVGDFVWVNCPEAGLDDMTETINFAGEETHPIKLRVSAMQQPVRPDHGVYVIHNHTEYGGANAVEHLTKYVKPAALDQFRDPVTVEFDPQPTNRKQVRGRRYRKGWDS